MLTLAPLRAGADRLGLDIAHQALLRRDSPHRSAHRVEQVERLARLQMRDERGVGGGGIAQLAVASHDARQRLDLMRRETVFGEADIRESERSEERSVGQESVNTGEPRG